MSLEKERFTSPYLFSSQYGELMYKPKHLWKILDVRLDIVLQLYIREEHRILDGHILTSTFGYEREVNAPMNSKLQHPPPPLPLSGNPGHLTVLRVRGAGNLNLAWMGWGILSGSAKSFQWNIFHYGGV